MRAVSLATIGALFVVALASTLLAQSPSAESAPPDFRVKVTFAYGTVFAVVLIYLFISHRRNARVSRDMEMLEERLEELEQTDEKEAASSR